MARSEPPSPEAAATLSDASFAGPTVSTHFLFQHKVFSVLGSYFAIAQDTNLPTFFVPLGEIQGVLTVSQIVSGFDIKPDSSDATLLKAVEKGLNFVKRISPGDSIPRELLDGSASWTVDDRHRMIAEKRVAVQLANWVGGPKVDSRDLTELLKVGGDPETQLKVAQAVSKVADRLGLGGSRREEVIDKVERLGRELSYIEALRDRFASIKMIAMKVAQLQSLYGPDRGQSEEAARIIILMRKPAGEYDSIFTHIDLETSEIVTLLLKFTAEVKYIRDKRDELHRKFLMWDDLIRRWQELVVEMGPAAEALLRDTYRFTARHFPQSTDWQLQLR
jgi:hypothetical protein